MALRAPSGLHRAAIKRDQQRSSECPWYSLGAGVVSSPSAGASCGMAPGFSACGPAQRFSPLALPCPEHAALRWPQTVFPCPSQSFAAGAEREAQRSRVAGHREMRSRPPHGGAAAAAGAEEAGWSETVLAKVILRGRWPRGPRGRRFISPSCGGKIGVAKGFRGWLGRRMTKHRKRELTQRPGRLGKVVEERRMVDTQEACPNEVAASGILERRRAAGHAAAATRADSAFSNLPASGDEGRPEQRALAVGEVNADLEDGLGRIPGGSVGLLVPLASGTALPPSVRRSLTLRKSPHTSSLVGSLSAKATNGRGFASRMLRAAAPG
ncbi:hypothetical protein DFJ74DRAFT_667864 [Hyaloraphidium curvatum]|nr:hypothetical protein DFJ74DRAFT_667864 [Hyaloraphidium curvatum]